MSGCGNTATHEHAAPQITEPTIEEGPGTVSLTPKAVEMVKEAIKNDNLDGFGLRVAVVGGGCSGYQYSLDLSKEVGPLDTVLEQDGVKIYVDMMSMAYLAGTMVDYVDGMHGSGFSFINPKAVKTCGCGSSFST